MTSVLPISPSCKSGPNSGYEDYLSKRSNGPGGLRLGCFGVVKMPPVKPGMANRCEVSLPRSGCLLRRTRRLLLEYDRSLEQRTAPLWNSFPLFVIWGCSPCPSFIHHTGRNNDRIYFLGMSNKPCKVQQMAVTTINITPFSGMPWAVKVALRLTGSDRG